MAKEWCFLTRDTGDCWIRIWPADVGIRMFEGCVQFGAAWSKKHRTTFLKGKPDNDYNTCEYLYPAECRKRFGFYPEAGEAWDIDGKKRTKVELAFSP